MHTTRLCLQTDPGGSTALEEALIKEPGIRDRGRGGSEKIRDSVGVHHCLKYTTWVINRVRSDPHYLDILNIMNPAEWSGICSEMLYFSYYEVRLSQ